MASLSRIAINRGTRGDTTNPGLGVIEMGQGHAEKLKYFDPFKLDRDHWSHSSHCWSLWDHRA